MFTLFTDTDCDMTPESCKKYGYKLISMPYTIDDTLVYPYEDFDVFDAHAYYERLRGGTLPTTSAVPKEKYIEYFEPEFAAGRDILYVHFSAAMTNTFDFMNQALKELKEKYPERKFYDVDTKGITTISKNIAYTIGDMVQAGKTPEEIVEWAKEGVFKYAMYFMADDLKFFHRSGRVNGLSAVMGTLIGIRPIITMDANGKMTSVGKAKGRKKTLEALVEKMEELGDDVAKHRIMIGHSDSQDIAEELAEMIRAKFGECDIEYVVVNPTAGAHCGPNGIGVTFSATGR